MIQIQRRTSSYPAYLRIRRHNVTRGYQATLASQGTPTLQLLWSTGEPSVTYRARSR
jgi:hypothetical protein